MNKIRQLAKTRVDKIRGVNEMKKWTLIVLAGIMMATASFTSLSPPVQAAEEKVPAPAEKSLTDAQKTELEAMHKDVLQREKAYYP